MEIEELEVIGEDTEKTDALPRKRKRGKVEPKVTKPVSTTSGDKCARSNQCLQEVNHQPPFGNLAINSRDATVTLEKDQGNCSANRCRRHGRDNQPGEAQASVVNSKTVGHSDRKTVLYCIEAWKEGRVVKT